MPSYLQQVMHILSLLRSSAVLAHSLPALHERQRPFGPLQTSVASSLGMSQPWLAGASSLGGCIGKMLSPQSIALGIGAVGAVAEGKEGEVMRGTVGYCLFLLIIAGIITIIAPSVVPFLVN